MSDQPPSDARDERSGPTGSPHPPEANTPSPSGGTPPPPPPSAPSWESAWETPARSSGPYPADLGTRIGARLIDYIILTIASLLIVVPLFVGAFFADVSGFSFGFGIGNVVSSIVSATIYIGYFAWMESSRGQTLGKMMLNVRTVAPGGGNPSFEQAVKRNAWLALSVIPVFGWLLQLAAVIYIMVTINSSATNQGWHDEFADGTMVVKSG
jgi:uncharacterized RDD family membrane protein YckC